MEWKTLVYGIISIIVLLTVSIGFYKLTNPQVDVIKSLKCNIPVIGSMMEDCIKKEEQQQQIQQQTREAQIQNIKNIQKVIINDFERCGKNSKIPCRCTYPFNAIGSFPLIFMDIDGKIRIIRGTGEKDIIDDKDYPKLYIDDGNHNLVSVKENYNTNKIIFVKDIDKKKYTVYKESEKKENEITVFCEDCFWDKVTKYSVVFTRPEKYISFEDQINNLGLFRNGDKVGIYLPKYNRFKTKEINPLDECKSISTTP